MGLLVEHAMTVKTPNQKWIVDSGTTTHMCNNRHLFREFHTLHHQPEVTLGDGHALKATGRGKVSLQMITPKGKVKCTLHDVLLVPRLAYNLFSVAKSTEAGKTTEFSNSTCSIWDGNRLVAKGFRERGGLYHLDYETCPVQAHLATSATWHRRFGHLGEQSLTRLNRQQMVEGLKMDSRSPTGTPCESCLKGKQHRNPFPEGGKRPNGLLEMIHSDVCGKMGHPSLNKAEYFVTFVDGYSHYTWVYPLQRKDQVLETFINWKTMVENISGKKLKTFRTDNGGEYTSGKFQEYLKRHGIRHETTVPRNPEQNGTAERMNRTLVETARSMLADAQLPKSFWAEALNTATYLKNRSPTKALNATPYEIWSGGKPDVSHLRVFGCDAFSHIPREERGKLDFKTRKCWLMGYGATTKAYRLYDRTRRRVFHSRDVTFDEQGGEEVQKESAHEGDLEILDSEKQREPVEDVNCEERIEEIPNKEEDPEKTKDQTARRSERSRAHPDRYGEWATMASATEDPATLSEALSSERANEWRQAMESDYTKTKYGP